MRFVALLAAAVLTVALPARAGDLSEPKAAAMTFVTAMSDHDLATMRDASIGNDEEHRRVEAMSDLIAAQKHYAEAAAAKFGATAQVPRRNVAADFEEKLKAAELKIDGDVASLQDPKDPGSPPLKLKRESGQWKIDLSSMQMRGAAASVAGEQMSKMAGVMNTTADEIAAGKYATFIEAQKALGQRMMPLMGGGARPSSAPSNQGPSGQAPSSQPAGSK